MMMKSCHVFNFGFYYFENTTCTLPKSDRKIFERFFKRHNFSTHWDCGLENLAKGEFDRAANATTSYPLSEAAKKYFTLTSKGRNVKNALRKIPVIFLEDGHYLNKSNKFGCNTEKRKVQVIACIFEPRYATNIDYQDEDSTKL